MIADGWTPWFALFSTWCRSTMIADGWTIFSIHRWVQIDSGHWWVDAMIFSIHRWVQIDNGRWWVDAMIFSIHRWVQIDNDCWWVDMSEWIRNSIGTQVLRIDNRLYGDMLQLMSLKHTFWTAVFCISLYLLDAGRFQSKTGSASFSPSTGEQETLSCRSALHAVTTFVNQTDTILRLEK